MCFKGTTTRTWNDINIALDELGSNYNAYTGKDRTFYYGWVRTEHLERLIELLADLMRSTLPPDEFETEKNVIIEEIAMAGDDLASTAHDLLYESLCAGSSMAWPVLGYETTVEKMTRNQMAGYFARRYSPENLTLVIAGNVTPPEVIALAERYCGPWTPSGDPRVRGAPTLTQGRTNQMLDRFNQQALLLAFPSASASDPLDETAEAVAAILGGVNSRFYWNIVQEGLSPRAGVFREEYHDFGIITLFALCEPENSDQCLEAMRREARRLRDEGVERKEIERVKNLRRTSLAVESEAPFYRLGQLADDLDYFGRPRSPQERFAAVEQVSDKTIAEYLNRFSITGEGMLVSVGPRELA
jgi:predicted Zn-dependent peptidase